MMQKAECCAKSRHKVVFASRYAFREIYIDSPFFIKKNIVKKEQHLDFVIQLTGGVFIPLQTILKPKEIDSF